MAEALLRDQLRRADPPLPDSNGWRVTSAGTWAMAGDRASEFGRWAMARRGLDLSAHRSRIVTAEMLAEADLVLVMTRSHREALCAEFPAASGKIHLLAQMAGPAFDVPDPFGSSMADYEQTARELEDLIARGLPTIRRLADGAEETGRPETGKRGV